MGCRAYDLLALGGFDVEGIGHGYEIEDVLLRLLFQHQRAVLPWIGEPPAPQAPCISLARTDFSSAGGATLPPQGWQLGLSNVDFSKMWQMQLEQVNPELKAKLDMTQPARFCLMQLFEQHRLDLRAKMDAGRLVRNIVWNDEHPPLTAECIATWLVSSKVSAGWNETSRNKKTNTCFQQVLDQLNKVNVAEPVGPKLPPPLPDPRSDISAEASSSHFEPRPKIKTSHYYYEPRPKTAPAAGCTSKSKPMEKAALPSAPLPEAASEADTVLGSTSTSSANPPGPAEEKPPECEIFGLSTQATEQCSQVKQSKAEGTRKFPGIDGPGLFLVTFGTAYIGQGLCNFGCDETLKTNYLQRVSADAIGEEAAAEIVSATIGIDLYTGDPGMGSLRQVEVVAIDARSFGDPPSECANHIGQHPNILRHITRHENFAPWLRYALTAVHAASQRLRDDKQSRLHICCFDNQGRVLAVTLWHWFFLV